MSPEANGVKIKDEMNKLAGNTGVRRTLCSDGAVLTRAFMDA